MKKKRLTILDKAELAMKEAVEKVIEEHRRDGRPLYFWRDGQVKAVMAEDLDKE